VQSGHTFAAEQRFWQNWYSRKKSNDTKFGIRKYYHYQVTEGEALEEWKRNLEKCYLLQKLTGVPMNPINMYLLGKI